MKESQIWAKVGTFVEHMCIVNIEYFLYWAKFEHNFFCIVNFRRHSQLYKLVPTCMKAFSRLLSYVQPLPKEDKV